MPRAAPLIPPASAIGLAARRSVRTGLALAFGAAALVRAQGMPDYERAPIHYTQATPQDEVASLLARIARHEVTLAGSDQAIVRTLLRELGVPGASQIVVFSKTSLQGRLIRPQHPRAIYFSDSVYLGWVPGGLIEVAAIDPELGPIFYRLDPGAARTDRTPFVRESSCLRCHGDNQSGGFPSLLARSVYAESDGHVLDRHGSVAMDDRTPFEQRWGGWFVTGYRGTLPHRGNTFGRERGDQLIFEPGAGRPAELGGYFDTSPYLAATSDVVALAIFQHQVAMHNTLTRAAHGFRRALASQQALQRALHEPETTEAAYTSTRSALRAATDDILDTLLFREAAPLPAGVNGSTAFREAFAAGARRSHDGHALKDLSLQGRLFTNRCSFLIYSASFAALPPALRHHVLDRLGAILRDGDTTGRYAHLEADERRRILVTLRETLPDFRRRLEVSTAAPP
jgi:hypothetical protein